MRARELIAYLCMEISHEVTLRTSENGEFLCSKMFDSMLTIVEKLCRVYTNR